MGHPESVSRILPAGGADRNLATEGNSLTKVLLANEKSTQKIPRCNGAWTDPNIYL